MVRGKVARRGRCDGCDKIRILPLYTLCQECTSIQAIRKHAMINRRHLILSTAALALSATIATPAPAAEVRDTRMVTIRYTWPGGTISDTQVPAWTLPCRPYHIEQPLRAEDGGGVLVGNEVM